MAAGDSGIPVRPGSCWRAGGMLLLSNPQKMMSLQWATEEACLIVVVTLHFEMVVSGSKVADLQRVGMLSSLGEFSISIFQVPARCLKVHIFTRIPYILGPVHSYTGSIISGKPLLNALWSLHAGKEVITYQGYWGRFCAQFCACYSSLLSLSISSLPQFFTLPICRDSNRTYSFMWNPNHTEDWNSITRSTTLWPLAGTSGDRTHVSRVESDH